MDTVFWVLSKIFWMVAVPSRLLFVVLLVGAALLWTRWRRAGRWVVSGVVLFLTLLNIAPITEFLWKSLEDRFPPPQALPDKVDGVIILAGLVNLGVSGDRNQPALNDSAERILALVELGRKYPDARLVFTGGSGGLTTQEYKETTTVRRILNRIGMDVDRVVFESQSRNTWENAVYSKKLMEPEKGETWILVTSAFHMPRSVGIFRQAGWEVLPYPVDFNTTREYRCAGCLSGFGVIGHLAVPMHQWIGLGAYWLTGRSSSIFPAPRE